MGAPQASHLPPRRYTDVDWQKGALCTQVDPETFWPPKGQRTLVQQAKAVCLGGDGCPVCAQCLDYALTHHEREGVWGGMTYRERRKEARERRKKAKPALESAAS